jgi:hypothetical protein
LVFLGVFIIIPVISGNRIVGCGGKVSYRIITTLHFTESLGNDL